MVLILFNLLQAQPQKTSLVVWIIAIVLFLGGISMLVYFFTRLKKVDKEPEEDWSLSRNTLFVARPASAKEAESAAAPDDTPAASPERLEALEASEEPSLKNPYEIPPYVPYTETRELASEEFTGPSVTTPRDVTPWVSTEPEPVETPEGPALPTPSEPEPAVRATEALGSVPNETEAVEPVREEEAAVFDEEVWAELEPSSPAGTMGEGRPSLESETAYRVENEEPEAFARVDTGASRAPFEPPRIEPLSPRASQPEARPSKPASEPVPASFPASVHAPQEVEPSIPSVRRERKVAGSVLGIPSEAGKGPLILGTPSKEAGEFGIGSLTNYGKDTSERTGNGGTIALALAILLVGGAVLSYFKVPSVHSRVDEIVARMRGTDRAQQAAIESEPKARIFPARAPEVVKNIVKARGAVDNISQQVLENLYVELSLERYDGGPADTLNVQVNPSTLAASQRGIYEFPYDGKQYRGYGIKKLTSNGEEVKFTAPKQQ